MKILHVNSLLQLGGAETVMRQLLRNFPEAEVAVAGGKSFPPGVHSLYPRPLARLYHSRFHKAVERLAPRDRWTDRAFRRLAEGKHEIIHLHNFHGLYATVDSLGHVARRRPLVWTFHALWGVTGGCDHPRDCRGFLEACGHCPQLGRWPLGPVDDTAEQLAAKLSTLGPLPLHIITPSRWMAEKVRASPVGHGWHVHHIPNAVDAEVVRALARLPKPRPGGRPVILLVNRNFRDEQKGFPIAREALRQFAAASGLAASARAKVVLAGEHSAWAAADLREWDCHAAGYVVEPEALAALYAAADIFLFASPAENFPCVVLEAMAASLCIVATPTGGVIEQIENGVTGLLARDISGPALAEALAAVCGDPAKRASLGAAARARVMRDFSEEVFAARHREVYAEALQRCVP